MSRAYRITVKESTVRELTGSDEIAARLDVLEILPPERMGQLLKDELRQRGFEEQPDGTFARKDGEVTVTIDVKECEVRVRAEVGEEVKIDVRRDGRGYDDVGPNQRAMREVLQKQLKEDADKQAAVETERLQERATTKLEERLCDLQPELGEIVNRVTRQALKEKASQLGSIKEIAEDEASGSLTIRVEV